MQVLTQQEFVDLLRLSTAFRIAITDMLAPITSSFLLDVAVTNPAEPLLLDQTSAQARNVTQANKFARARAR